MNREIIAEMLAQYKLTRDSLSEKEKAVAETKIWKAWLTIPIREKVRGRDHWFSINFGESHKCQVRAHLLNAGSWVEPLWELIDQGTSRNTVHNLFRQACMKAIEGKIQNEEALKQVLIEYNSTGFMVHTHDGRHYRRPTIEEKRRLKTDSIPVQSVEMDTDTPQISRSKQFITQLSALTDEYLRTSVPDLSEIDGVSMRLLKDEFISFVRESSDELRRKVLSMRHQNKKEKEAQNRVSRNELRLASEVLGIAIVNNKDVDLRKAKKIMLRRLAQLHPDKIGFVSEPQKEEYTAVKEAYDTIERYMDGRKSRESETQS
jgi:membrane-associated HD superfamily phosphohydrolase